MDTSLQQLSLKTFYFGSYVANHDPTNDGVIDRVAGRAYRDLNRTLIGIGTHHKKDFLVDNTQASLVKFVSHLSDVESQSEFDEIHQSWCQERISFFGSHPHQSRSMNFSYGQAQKWVNMTCKYLAVLSHPDILRVYKSLHVPVDKIVFAQADKLDVPRPSRRTPWSKLNHEQYSVYQLELRERIAQVTDFTAPLDWEASSWSRRS